MPADALPKPTVGHQLRGWLVVALSLAPTIAASVAVEQNGNFHHVGWALRLAYTVPVTLVIGGALVLVARALLRGSPLEGIGWVYPMIYAPVAAFILVGWANVALDRGPPRLVDAPVKERIKRAKGPNRIVLQAWDDAEGTVDLPDTFRSGPFVRLEVHRGALGLEWVREVR